MRKVLILIMLAVAVMMCFTACGNGSEAATTVAEQQTEQGTEAEVITTEAEEPTTVTEGTPGVDVTTSDETTAEEAQTTENTGEEETTSDSGDILPSADVAVMSFNLDANEATIAKRSKYIISLMLEYLPDSIGVQECRGTWNNKITKGLRDKYDYVGVAADGKAKSDSAFATYIFYLKDKYKVVDSGTFWLSKTPDTPSKYSNTVDCNRTCTWVILENKETGYRYAHINSHLDWMDVKATDYQIQMIREQIARFDAMGIPTFATGDYNTDEGSSTYKLMLENENIADSKFIAKITMSLATYHDNGKYDMETTLPIDFCFVTKNRMTVNEYKVIYEKPDGMFISDHNGLYVKATLNETDNTYLTAKAPDISDVKITVTEIGTNKVTVSFNQAEDTSPIEYYNAVITDKSGKEIAGKQIASGYRAYGYSRDDSLTAAFSGLDAKTEYTVTVSAVNLFGKESDKVTATVMTAEEIQPEDPGKADLFDLDFKDGGFCDKSDNGLAITNVGTVGHTDGFLAVFDKKGNLKIPDFKNSYSLLSDGFSIEVCVTFHDTDTYASIISNMHAGGFGISVENSALSFDVNVGGAYKGVSVGIEKNVAYHIVAVYDGDSVAIYLNGQLAASENVSGKMGFATDNGAKYLCIGADSDASGAGEYPAYADITAARVYSYALTEAQAIGAYNNTK